MFGLDTIDLFIILTKIILVIAVNFLILMIMEDRKSVV